MTKSESELDELKDLQMESQKFGKSRKHPEPLHRKRRPLKSGSRRGEGGEPLAKPVELIEDLAGPVENILSELEEAASEHPALALLAAFGIGIFVGQLLSRR